MPRLHACTAYVAVKYDFKFLRDTMNDGLHYMRQDLNDSLPSMHIPTIPIDTHDVVILTSKLWTPNGFADSNWAGDTKHRRSI